MKQKFTFHLLAALIGVVFTVELHAQTTDFTYQGHLTDNGGSATGLYDFRFELFDAVTDGASLGIGTRPAETVSNGLFTLTVGFGAGFDGGDRWLEIGVRTNGGGGYTTVSPRQRFTSAPYAITAGNLNGVLTSSSLSGTYSAAVDLSNPANQISGAFSGDGSSLTGIHSLDAADGNPTDALFVNNPGNVGIGTLSPDNTLHIHKGSAGAASGNANAPLVVENGSTCWISILSPSANERGVLFGDDVGGSAVGGIVFNNVGTTNGLQFRVNGNSTKMVIDAQGDVGIGTTTPSSSLDVNGDIEAQRLNIGSGHTLGGIWTTIAGGASNSISGGFAGASASAIGGGFLNSIESGSEYGTIAGGRVNDIGVNAYASTIGGGEDNNIASNSQFSAIPGGRQNDVGADASYAFAAGRRAQANHTGAFVWADSANADFASSSSNQFLIRASGGVGIGTTSPEDLLHVWGGSAGSVTAHSNARLVVEDDGNAYMNFLTPSTTERGLLFGDEGSNLRGAMIFNNSTLQNGFQFRTGGNNTRMSITSAGNVGIGSNAPAHPIHHSSCAHLTAAGVWTSVSDRAAKEHFAPIDPAQVLDKVAALPITEWKYKVEADGVRHLGPVAQDFHAAFGLGSDDKGIGAVDADGVALAAIQGLHRIVVQKEVKIQELERRLEKLEQLLSHN